MKKILKYFVIFGAVFIPTHIAIAAGNFTGDAYVNITSDTASMAKNMAMEEARRQIILDVISRYADAPQITTLVKNTKSGELANLISSTGIDDEKISATTYSANIKMTIDELLAKKWLSENNIQSWMGDDNITVAGSSVVIIQLPNGLRDWIDLNQIWMQNDFDIGIKNISDGKITANIPMNKQGDFIKIMRNAGWNATDNSGIINIWK